MMDDSKEDIQLAQGIHVTTAEPHHLLMNLADGVVPKEIIAKIGLPSGIVSGKDIDPGATGALWVWELSQEQYDRTCTHYGVLP